MPWTPKADSPGVIALRDPKGGLHGLDAAEARALAASLLAAADEVEPEERSCFTCAFNSPTGSCLHPGTGQDERELWDYITRSGADTAEDWMPTDRTVRCPGWRKG